MTKRIFTLFIGFLLLTVCINPVFGQKYKNKKLGWTMPLPSGWVITGGEELKRLDKKGKAMLEEDENVDNSVYVLKMKKGEGSNLSVTWEYLEPEKRILDAIIYDVSTSLVYSLRKISFESDEDSKLKFFISKETEIKIDSKEFTEFHVDFTISGESVDFGMVVYLALVKDGYFSLMINYKNNSDREEIERAFLNSKFK